MSIPIVNFMYLTPGYMRYVCNQFADMPLDKLKAAFNELATHSLEGKATECVALSQILYSDIERIKDDHLPLYDKTVMEYHALIQEFGEERVKLFITEDEENLKRIIKNLLDFVFDKVFKTDTIQVTFLETNRDDTYQSNYPSLIYGVIQEYFEIKEHIYHFGGRAITITKRSA